MKTPAIAETINSGFTSADLPTLSPFAAFNFAPQKLQ
jgi:hypothetical protein